MQQRTLALPALLGPGALAGIVGAVLIDIYLLVTLTFASHLLTLTSFYQFVASGALGRAAYGNPATAYLGLALHLLVGVGWGIGYAYVAARTPQLRERPLISGIVFGILVLIAMGLVEVAANIYVLPNTAALANNFIAHIVFFGIPIAYIVKDRLLRAGLANR